MGRPSKLTEKQWQDISRRLIAGESARGLAAEYGVSEAAIRKRLGSHKKDVKSLANQGLAFEQAFQSAPVSTQVGALDLMARMRSISNHLAGAAEYGAATAHRLAGIAHGKAAEIDDAAPLSADSLESLKGIAALTRTANEASEIGLGLLKANKDMVDGMNQAAKPTPQRVVVEVQDASLPGA